MSGGGDWRSRLRVIGLPVRRGPARNHRDIEQSGLFDLEWYVARVPDAGSSGLHPLDHYLTIGWKQGHSPGPLFDSAWYLHRYNDVAAAQLAPLIHYVRHGRSEGRLARPPLDALFDGFQSLGGNCEFGLVQRHFGSETLGLLRFAQVPIGGLIAALEARFAAFSPETLQVEVDDKDEYQIVLPAYGMRFHTDVYLGAVVADRVRENEGKRLGYLKRKFLQDLDGSAKTFVYTSTWIEKSSRKSIDQLLETLRSFGKHRLLWVTEARADRPAGSVERLGHHLMRGYMDRFSVDPAQCSFATWQTLCSEAARRLDSV